MIIESSTQLIVLKDDIMWDVWLAGGQSNMEFNLRTQLVRSKKYRPPICRMYDFIMSLKLLMKME